MLSLQLTIVWPCCQMLPHSEYSASRTRKCGSLAVLSQGIGRSLLSLKGTEVALSTRLGDGQWEDTSATSEIKRDLQGCLLSERLAGSRQKRPFHVWSLFAFDNHSKLLQQVLTDSEHGLLSMFQGGKNQDEVDFDLPLTRDDGSKWLVRRSYFAVTQNSFTVENKHSQDGGKSWRVVVKARYVRKK